MSELWASPYFGIALSILAFWAGEKLQKKLKSPFCNPLLIAIPVSYTHLLAKETGVKILPVDSEHSAIFQCLNGENRSQLKKILLTASGGPFRGRKLEDLKNIQVEDALKHPNWAMGRKITID